MANVLGKARTKTASNNNIVLLPLEYHMYREVEQSSEAYRIYISDRDNEYFWTKSVFEKAKFIWSMDPLEVINGLKVKISPEEKITGSYDGVYLNRNGDMTNNKIENRRSDKILLGKMKKFEFDKHEYPSAESKQCLIDFLEFCKEKNVKVFVTYPSYLYHAKSFEGQDLKAINGIKKFWQAQPNVVALGSYEEFLYDVGDFYDTIDHLNDVGKEKRTKQLIKYLKEHGI